MSDVWFRIRWPVAPLFFLGATLLAPVSAALANSWEEARLAEIPTNLSIPMDRVCTSNRGTFVERWSARFSPDGKRVAYAAVDGKSWFPVVGNKVGDGFDAVHRPIFAGGQAIFRVGKRRTESTEAWWIWIDGKRIGPEDSMGELGVSSDGRRIAYWAQPGAKVGNAAPPSYSRYQLCVARKGNADRWTVSRGGRWVQPAATAPLLSADGKKVFTMALKPTGWVFLMKAGKRESERSPGSSWLDRISVHPKGAPFALVTAESSGMAETRTQVQFRGSFVGSQYDSVGWPVIDPGGKNIATVVTVGRRKTVAINDESNLEGRFDHVLEVRFNPTGKRIAFIANIGGRMSDQTPGFVVGGKSLVVIREIDSGRPWILGSAYLEVRGLEWDEAANRVAYCARDRMGWRVVCGEKASPAFLEVADPVFAPDGESVGFGAQTDRELWWKELSLDR